MRHEQKKRSIAFRLEPRTVTHLKRRAQESRATQTALVERYIEEGLRQDEHPLIYFREGEAGRRPAVVGSRLSVDAKLRVHMRTEIVDLHRRLGVTFVYVTHDQAEAMTMSDRVGVMLEGTLLQVAPPQEIYNNPADRQVAEFVGSPKINMLDGKLDGRGAIDIGGARVAVDCDLPVGTLVTVGIRPEALELAGHAAGDTLSGRVRLCEHMGSDLFVHADLPGRREPLIARVAPAAAGPIGAGDTVHLRIPPHLALVFDSDGKRVPAGGRGLAMLRGRG